MMFCREEHRQKENTMEANTEKKYIVCVGEPLVEQKVAEFDTKEAAIEDADMRWYHLSVAEKNRYKIYVALEGDLEGDLEEIVWEQQTVYAVCNTDTLETLHWGPSIEEWAVFESDMNAHDFVNSADDLSWDNLEVVKTTLQDIESEMKEAE